MKIVIICSDFQNSNIRKLPWKYIYEVAKYLNNRHDITVITDSNKRDIDELKIIHVERLFIPLKGESEELLDIIKQINPDKCIMLLGLTSFLRMELRINKPVIGIFTSPIYSIKELIRNIGIKDSIKYYKYTTIHFINALIPDLFVKKWSDKFDKIIFLSNYTKNKAISKGLNEKKSVLIPLGLDEIFLKLPDKQNVQRLKKEINPDNIPIIMYFTSPLTLRGTDTLIKAFSIVRKQIPAKLIFLSRIDYDELLREEEILKNIARKEGILDSVEIISKYLNPEEIKEYLSVADIVCLPFKIVISDVPISILEAMAVGKPVVSTSTACIPELLNNIGIAVPSNNINELSKALNKLLDNEKFMNEFGVKGREYIENYPFWQDTGKEFSEIIENL